MVSKREPNARTPLSRKELQALRAEMKQQQISKVRETYRTMWEMSKMFGDAPPRPWVIQTLVQAWQEIIRGRVKFGSGGRAWTVSPAFGGSGRPRDR
jgi:hypothetical protein